MRVSTGADVSFASPIDQSVMYSGRGRDHGCRHDFEGGRGSFGAGHNFSGGCLMRDRGTVCTVVRITISLKSAE